MSRDDPQMKIRLPAELKARIEESAVANKRTMNAEIIARLDASLAIAQWDLFDDKAVDLAARVDAGYILVPAMALLEKLIVSKLGTAEKLAPMLTLAGTLAQTMSAPAAEIEPLLTLSEKLQRAEQLVEDIKAAQNAIIKEVGQPKP